MSLVKLPYLGKDGYGRVNRSPVGYTEIDGVEKYNNAKVRNVIIVRVDLLKYLNKHFSKETIDKYRVVIYKLIAGYWVDKQKNAVRDCIIDLYKMDSVFRVKMGMIFYFRDTEFESLSIYQALIEDVKVGINNAYRLVVNSVPHVKVLFDSELYLYLSVSNSVVLSDLQNIVGLEVVSRC